MSQFFINVAIDRSERFDMQKFLAVTDNLDPLTSVFFTDLKKLSKFGQFVVQTEEERPDLVSFEIFGDTQFWWVLMIYNDIISVDEIKSGLVFNFPSAEDIEDLFFGLKARQSAVA